MPAHSDRVPQWLFVDAATRGAAIRAATAALTECAWAHTFHIDEDAIVHADAVADVVELCAEEQIRHVHEFALICHPDSLLALADEHDPRTTWDDGGAQVIILSAIGDIIAGLWTPWSAGYDVTAVRGDFATVIARLTDTPAHQWAVPATITTQGNADE